MNTNEIPKGWWLNVTVMARFSGTYWVAYECENQDDTNNDNNLGVSFKTFKELKRYSQSF